MRMSECEPIVSCFLNIVLTIFICISVNLVGINICKCVCDQEKHDVLYTIYRWI